MAFKLASLETIPFSSDDEPVRRVLVAGNGGSVLSSDLKKLGFLQVNSDEDPQLVITYGGDGALLGADRSFPHLPKMPIRRDADYEKCPDHGNVKVLSRLLEKKVHRYLLPRIMAKVGDKTLYAINDIVFHNERATSAVRYRVRIDGEPYSNEIVGDGLVAATPFGSSAYYRSITNSVFRVGLGVAFNNSTEALNHLVLAANSVVDVEVTRGPAIVTADNSLDPVRINQGGHLRFCFSDSKAEIWELGNLFCKKCHFKATGRPAGMRHV
jgi:NAD kinase